MLETLTPVGPDEGPLPDCGHADTSPLARCARARKSNMSCRSESDAVSRVTRPVKRHHRPAGVAGTRRLGWPGRAPLSASDRWESHQDTQTDGLSDRSSLRTGGGVTRKPLEATTLRRS